ncbi:MAG: Gfo/Idh/MocA family oxidoreductase [Planctomycetota bacterium]|nr:Gfo/Idh/MocA family oxidoreductase [Planctomycetota bacterium]
MSQRLRVVLVGCGGITNAWLSTETYKNEIELVGLIDLDPDAPARLIEKHDLPKDLPSGTDLAAMLADLKPDAVFDCTIPKAHPIVTTTALKAGCHVMGEKPMAEQFGAATEMVNAARDAGKVYAVIQNRRYNTNIRRLKAFLDSGAIGRVREVHADFFIAAHFGGFREDMDHVLILDMAIHSFDQGRMLAGKRPKSVLCHEWNPPGSWYRHGASAIASFEMTDEVVFTYRGSWTTTGAETSWECSWRIIGTEGAVTWDGSDGFSAERLKDVNQASSEKGGGLIRERESIEVPEIEIEGFRSGHDGLLHDFVEAVRAGTEPETICTDNIYSVAMIHKAVESAEAGRKVEIPEI